MIIGLSGKKQHGKSTVAKYLVNRYGFHEVSWAEPLKEIIGKQLFRFTDMQLTDNQLKEMTDPFWGISPRKALQIVGTECFRKQVCDDFWVKLGVRKIEIYKDANLNVVVSDCRFPNEADAIEKLGGKMIRVVKTDAEVTDAHASETGLDDYEFTTFNAKTGDIESLHAYVDYIMKYKDGKLSAL